jgi:hypothetical protein
MLSAFGLGSRAGWALCRAQGRRLFAWAHSHIGTIKALHFPEVPSAFPSPASPFVHDATAVKEPSALSLYGPAYSGPGASSGHALGGIRAEGVGVGPMVPPVARCVELPVAPCSASPACLWHVVSTYCCGWWYRCHCVVWCEGHRNSPLLTGLALGTGGAPRSGATSSPRLFPRNESYSSSLASVLTALRIDSDASGGLAPLPAAALPPGGNPPLSHPLSHTGAHAHATLGARAGLGAGRPPTSPAILAAAAPPQPVMPAADAEDFGALFALDDGLFEL